MFSPQGPSWRELTMQALSSVEGGYDRLAPKFDHTPFRTSDRILDATADALRPLGPFGRGVDVCCGTGAGLPVRAAVCHGPLTGVDFSAGMLTRARRAHPDAEWVRADARGLPFAGALDLAGSFSAPGPLRPAAPSAAACRCGAPAPPRPPAPPAVFTGVHRALRPGGLFAFPLPGPPPLTSGSYWALAGFDLAMRVRNAVWRPPFVMYYRTCTLSAVRADLTGARFT